MPRGRAEDMHIIELTIPMSTADSLVVDGECHICANSFCATVSDPCCRLSTHLRCCTQPLCVKCLVQLAKQCKCHDKCKEIIALCPFCREISGISKSELFRGTRPVCKDCLKDQEEAAAADPVEDTTSTDAQMTEAPPQQQQWYGDIFSSL
jgi:hypothetical protein